MNKRAEAQEMDNPFVKLAQINVSEHIEKKNGLSYLSWPLAIDQLMRADPAANWEFHAPQLFGDSMMVSCTVTAFGKPVTMHLPVMDHRNKAIPNPNAFDVNKNMMRCLVKAIACHGLGLYIYAGEDLPEGEDGHQAKQPESKALTESAIVDFVTTIKDAKDMDSLKKAFGVAYKAAQHIGDTDSQDRFKAVYESRKTFFETAIASQA